MNPVSRGTGPLKERYRPMTLGELAPTCEISRLAKIGENNSARVFLFEGPSGCAKTSSARIVALRTVCESEARLTKPCLVCPSCKAITQGTTNYVEQNCADFRKIDDIREFAPTLNYLPMAPMSRRIVVLDEVQQLTNDAQNVLLKVLEECPKHALVILCTTSTKGIIKPLLQRCEKFTFKPLNRTESGAYLTYIIRAEKADGKVTSRDIDSIYEASGGSPREMLNLLQALLDGGTVDATADTGEGESPDALALYSALADNKWRAAAAILANPDIRAKAEGMRIQVENIARGAALKANNLVGAARVLEAMSGTVAGEPGISQYNMLVLKCLRAIGKDR